MPEFSVVIPCYNRAHSVLPTLKSVQDQTFTDFECVVVDDGSTDGAALAQVVEGLKDARFRIIRRRNGGGGAARNTGIEAARANWIAFLDSDDTFLPQKLERAYGVLQGHDNMTVHFSQVIVRRDFGLQLLKPSRAPHEGERIDDYLMADRGFIQTSTIVGSQALFAKVRFHPTLPYGQDTDFVIRLWQDGAQFAMYPTPLTVFEDQQIENRLSHTTKAEGVRAYHEARKSSLSSRAYWGYKGRAIAKFERNKNPVRAWVWCAIAVLRGCYAPKLAITVILQVALRPIVFRRFSDFMIRRFKLEP